MNEIELRKSVEANNRLAHFWGIVLLVSLVLEVALLLFFREGKSFMEIVTGGLTGLLVAVSVGLEVHFGGKAGDASLELQRLSDEKVAKANARAEEANLKAEQEKLARVKIEQQLAWRVIDEKQRVQMIEELKQFTGTEFTVSVAEDPEALFLLLNILDVMKRAGWTLHRPLAPLRVSPEHGFMTPSALTIGVVVRTPPSLSGMAGQAFVAFRLADLYPVEIVLDAQACFGERFHIEVGKKDVGLSSVFARK